MQTANTAKRFVPRMTRPSPSFSSCFVSKGANNLHHKPAETREFRSSRPQLSNAAFSTASTHPHVPVLLEESIEALQVKGGVFIDATFGAGGHSSHILRLLASQPSTSASKLFAFDRDPSAFEHAKALKQQYGPLLVPVHAKFSNMATVLTTKHGISPGSVDGILFDIGVSSMQIDTADRGFSYLLKNNGPLDMRMDPTENIPKASDIVNTATLNTLANLIFQNGQEHAAKAIAKAIVTARAKAPLRTTADLDRVVRTVVHRKLPSQLTFQALRIAVNDEFNELRHGLLAAEALLKPGGRLAVITFHSVERKMVKDFLKLCSAPVASPKGPRVNPSFEEVHRKAIKPTDSEEEENSRSKPAKLITAIRTRFETVAPDPKTF